MPRVTPSRTFGRANFLIILPREESFGKTTKGGERGGNASPIFAGYRELAWNSLQTESRDDSGYLLCTRVEGEGPLGRFFVWETFPRWITEPAGWKPREHLSFDGSLFASFFNWTREFSFRMIWIIPSIRSAEHFVVPLICIFRRIILFFQQLLFNSTTILITLLTDIFLPFSLQYHKKF